MLTGTNAAQQPDRRSPATTYCKGLGGNDTLNGGDGSDLLDGGPGNDKLNGGTGVDLDFAFSGDPRSWSI